MNRQLWTISNGLSFLRILLVIPIAVFVSSNETNGRFIAGGLILVAALTDLFDGILARRLNQVSDIGKFIDPLADKIAVGLITAMLAVQNKIPLWFFFTALARDVIIFLGGMYIKKTRGIFLQSTMTGKWTVTVVAVYILIVVLDIGNLGVVKDIFLLASIVLLTISFGLYSLRFFQIINQQM